MSKCWACDGTGEIITYDAGDNEGVGMSDVCGQCGGSGNIEEEE